MYIFLSFQALYNRLVPLSGGQRKFSPIQINRLKVSESWTLLPVQVKGHFKLLRLCVCVATGHREGWPRCSDWGGGHPLRPSGHRPQRCHLAERCGLDVLHVVSQSSLGHTFFARHTSLCFPHFSVGHQRPLPEEDHYRPITNWKRTHERGDDFSGLVLEVCWSLCVYLTIGQWFPTFYGFCDP